MIPKNSIPVSSKSSARPGRGTRTAGLTLREAEVIKLLFANRDKLNTPHTRGELELGWCRPRDIGGAQQSHHSNTLRRLARLGFAEKKSYLGSDTLSCVYRISTKGREAWELYSEHMRNFSHKVTRK